MNVFSRRRNTLIENTAFGNPPPSLLYELIESVIIAVIICAFIYIFVATPNIVHGPSMKPTFQENQLVLTTSRLAHWFGATQLGEQWGFDYSRGDIVVFHTVTGEDLIKRVIGVPDDNIMLRDGHVYINGQIAIEPYLADNVQTFGGSFLEDGDEITIPQEYYFVMGDNRGDSRDSRDIRVGLVKRNSVLGKVLVRYWPLNEFKIVMGESITI